jgi:hypothetical protein
MVDNIKMNLKEILWKGVEGLNLAHGRDKLWVFVKKVMDIYGP